jgi:hypothetical protein
MEIADTFRVGAGNDYAPFIHQIYVMMDDAVDFIGNHLSAVR